MPSVNAKHYILLQDFRGGAHGRVWLACTTTGRVCVLKFSLFSEFKLQDEKTIWNNVWEIPVKIQYIFNHPALVMPFVRPVIETDKENPKVKAAVESAITKMANHGFCHLDLR